MKKHYTFLEDVATADVAFEINAPDLNTLFQAGGEATFDVMVDATTVDNKITKKIHLTADSLDMLFYNFLEELIFLKDSESILFKEIICDVKNEQELHATLKGEIIDPKKHKLATDVKAVTMHMYKVEKTDNGYYAMVILDI